MLLFVRLLLCLYCFFRCVFVFCCCFYAPAIYNGGHIASPLSVRPYVIRVMALDLRMKNGFRAISFEYIDVLDSYFIYRYIIIKYRSSSIMGKIHQLLSELLPLTSV